MFRLTPPAHSVRKLALRLFREEQAKNPNLQGLSAAQKRIVVEKTFEKLSRNEMAALRQRAITWKLNESYGAVDEKKDVTKSRSKLTAYELFFKEQLSNPSIATIKSPRLLEKKLFAIFNTLPEETKKELERRAEEMSQSGYSKGFFSQKSTPQQAKRIIAKSPAQKQAPIKTALPKSNKNKNQANKKPKKAQPSPYNVFVREQMARVQHVPPKERMKIIATKWKAYKAQGVDSKGPAPSAGAGSRVKAKT
uniref:Kinetoplast DNA-associated protein n=1 Tax=Trypanosoma congolense (strain IL3000) TaxID=1068625 RepID=G0UX81_TRYCI|nr:conserved hypothetical protein [Trypanosoma congolense IL3000]